MTLYCFYFVGALLTVIWEYTYDNRQIHVQFAVHRVRMDSRPAQASAPKKVSSPSRHHQSVFTQSRRTRDTRTQNAANSIPNYVDLGYPPRRPDAHHGNCDTALKHSL